MSDYQRQLNTPNTVKEYTVFPQRCHFRFYKVFSYINDVQDDILINSIFYT